MDEFPDARSPLRLLNVQVESPDTTVRLLSSISIKLAELRPPCPQNPVLVKATEIEGWRNRRKYRTNVETISIRERR